MGRKSRRAVYDPSIMDRVDDIQPLDMTSGGGEPDPLSYDDNDNDHMDEAERSLPVVPYEYETQETEVLDPKLHDLPRTHKNRGRNRCLLALLVAAVLAIIITVSVVVSKNKKAASSSSSSSVPLAPPPSDLKDVCLQGYSNNDLATCHAYCAPADCCDFPSNFDLSCLKGNEDTCWAYHDGCFVLALQPGTPLTTNVNVPPAPADISTTCDLNNLASNEGIAACKAECDPYQCCYEQGQGNCAVSNGNCIQYASCLNLRAHDAIDPAIAQQVSTVCAYDYATPRQGRMECRDACKLGKCCFVGNDSCGPDRGGTDGAFCQQYLPCSILYNGALPPLGTPGDGIDDAVDDAMFDDDDFLADDDTFADDDINAPPGDDDTATDDFVVDDTLDTTSPVLPDPSADLTTACDRTQPTFNADTCKSLCEPAQCCQFVESLPQSCLAGNNWKCMVYQQSCASIYGDQQQTTTNVLAAPNNIADICSPTSLATTDGMESCNSICSPAKCCYDWNVPRCLDTDCRSYAPCLNLNTMTQDHSSVGDQVQQTCTEENVKDPSGFAHCEQVCLQFMCCFDETSPSCPPDVIPTCPQYSGCKYLHAGGNFDNPVQSGSQTQLDKPPENLAQICQENSLSDSNARAQCEEVCSKAKCCNLPEEVEGSCLRGHHYDCLQYHRECSVLDSNIGYQDPSANVNVNPASITLSDWCSAEGLANPDTQQLCKDECTKGNCCWSLNLEQGQSCRDNANCPSYAPCLALQAQNTVTSNGEIANDVNTKCATDNLASADGLAACQQVCEAQRCCWDPNFGACTAIDANACDQYSACGVALVNRGLYDDNTVDNSAYGDDTMNLQTDTQLAAPPDNLASICNETVLISDSNAVDLCKSVCSKASCCNLPDDVSGSCLNGNMNTCLLYHAQCSVLDKDIGYQQPSSTVNIGPASQYITEWCLGSQKDIDTIHNLCVQECSKAKCCWSLDLQVGQSCRDNPQCPGYAPCLALQANNVVDNQISTDVEQKCSAANIQTADGNALCNQVCADHKCCWDPQATSECYYAQGNCDQYAACKILVPTYDNSNPNNGGGGGGERKDRKWLR